MDDSLMWKLFQLMRYDFYPEITKEETAIINENRALIHEELQRSQRVAVLKIIDAQNSLREHAERSAFRSGLLLGFALWGELGGLTLPGA